MQRGYNSTIKIKKKICKNCKQEKYIFSRGRCSDCARIQDNQDVVEEETEPLAYLINDLDTLFSLIVRMSAADSEGMATCYTSGKKDHWTKMDNGHYISRKCMFLRWDFRNSRVQSIEDNRFKHGNLPEYGKRLENENPGITEILLEESRIVHKWDREELKAMAVDFNKRVLELKKKFK